MNTCQIVCIILIAIPFMVSCIKGNPVVGVVAGFVSLLLMSYAAGHGASIPEVLLIGIFIAGLGTAFSLHGS
ncbi:MAG: hypothetical protein ABIS50_16340 [Luteolibacter sp.]|uniref:hypothetical protein n=1 Tax=Luteolibacter sp. TaxID=1962973 RepID=UPI0032677AAD